MEIQILTWRMVLARETTTVQAVRTGSWSIWEVSTSSDTLLLPIGTAAAAVSIKFFFSINYECTIIIISIVVLFIIFLIRVVYF